MKRLLYINIILISSVLWSCNASRDAAESRGYMLTRQSQLGVNADHDYDFRAQKRMKKLNRQSTKRFKSIKKQVKRRNKQYHHWYFLWLA